nr:pilus assembly protein TadG-related protein [uncultured Lichenicoccus sp.]
MRGLRLKRGQNRGSVAVIAALALLPMTMIVGLAIDYSIYNQMRAQANLAIDAAAMHAVHAASIAYGNGNVSTTALQRAGVLAGQAWFAAQLGTTVHGNASATVTVTYTPSPSTFTALATYTGSVSVPFLGPLDLGTWPISGTATAVISNSYVEVLMLLDNSSSMLIGATTADIVALEQATPCSTQGANEGQAMSAYSWIYSPTSYGYGSGNVVPPATGNGNCDPAYDGAAAACTYPASFPLISTINPASCTNGGGSPATINGKLYTHAPNAPCAFACHNDAGNNDYYGLARSLTPAISLRLDVVQQAAAQVVTTLRTRQQAPGQFLVGIYQFNSTMQPLYPAAGTGEAGSDLAAALTTVQNVPANLAPNGGNTNFPLAADTLNADVVAAGDGSTAALARKNLFIVTDGMQDTPGSRVMGPMTSAGNEQLCTQFWNKGFNVFVLYTPYLPLPNPFYLSNDRQYVEPRQSSPVLAALQACARYPSNFFQASDPKAILSAMQTMLSQALNTAARVAD